MRARVLLVVATCVTAGASRASEGPLIESVDPFTGVDAGGNTVPGAQVPFGFVSLSPDTTTQPTSGYSSKSPIVGFSHTHVSGTGGGSKYGNFRVTPVVGTIAAGSLERGSEKADEVATPGFYAVTLTGPATRAELTATRLTGSHRYTFPRTKEAHLVLDACAVVRARPAPPSGQVAVQCGVRLFPPNRLEGEVHAIGGWNRSPYTLHFSAETRRPFATYGTWRNGKQHPQTQTAYGTDARAILTFDTSDDPVVELKVGVSFVSAAKARQNLNTESPGWGFDGVHARAREPWTAVLARVQIEGGSPDQRRIFASALYRAHVMPHDLTGDNAWWTSKEPHYEDFYCLWDTFRAVHPLLTILQPTRQRDIVRSLVDTYVHTGWIPDARIAGNPGLTQGGTHGDVVIADAFVKGLRGIDYRKAYEAMIKNAEVESPRPLEVGRELEEYRERGYMSMRHTRSATRTLEYAFNDFAVATVAEGLGKSADARKYRARARNWENLWDPGSRSIRPRLPDGRWLEPFSPDHSYPDKDLSYWESPFYEGTARQYSTFVPHDPQALIDKLGGDDGFVAWLDELFDRGHYEQGNEPDILAPYLYIHAGRPDRTAERVRHLLANEYRTGRAGLPGNDDAGTMSAWYVWGAMGLYPSAGQPFYYVGSPLFRRTRIELAGGKSFTIDAPDTSDDHKYVQSAALNGKPLERAFITHAELVRGGVLTLKMGPTPSRWGTTGPRPPSMTKKER